jgi:hypothetical protein
LEIRGRGAGKFYGPGRPAEYRGSISAQYSNHIRASSVEPNRLYVPRSKTQIGFDSFFQIGAILYIFQLTVAKTHDCKVEAPAGSCARTGSPTAAHSELSRASKLDYTLRLSTPRFPLSSMIAGLGQVGQAKAQWLYSRVSAVCIHIPSFTLDSSHVFSFVMAQFGAATRSTASFTYQNWF